MTGYLTNTKLENKARCEYAAKVSGFDVVFLDKPMPRDFDSHDFYDPKRLIGTHGSVYTNEPHGLDHGPFWRAWDAYSPRT